MVEVTNRSFSGEVKYTDVDYEMKGDFHQNPDTKEITTLNLSANKVNDGYTGNVSAYTENGELKLNMNSIPFMDMAGIAVAITSCINEIKEETV